MKRTIAFALMMLLAALPLSAQVPEPQATGTPQTETPTPPPDAPKTAEPSLKVEGPASAPKALPNLFGNFLNLDLQAAGQNTNSSKFEEYRDVPEGVGGPALRVFGETPSATWLVTGQNISQTDQRFYVWADTKSLEAEVFYDVIPHRLGNEAKSVEKIVSNEAQGISDNIQADFQRQLEARFANPATKNQINYAYLSGLVEPLLNTPEVFDLEFIRQRAGAKLGLLPNAPFSTTLTVFQENRDGNRSSGTSFGFGNVVETAEPVEYRTRDIQLSAEMPLMDNALLLRGSIGLNDFENSVSFYTFDNPFRVTDSTDSSAYQAPGSASVNGPAAGLISLPPDNRQFNAAFGGVFKLPFFNQRVTADLSVGRTQQDERLLPYTSNSAIIAQNPILAQPPQDSFDGEFDTTVLNVSYTARPLKRFNVTARYRFYELDNNSGRVETPGWVAFDATYHAVPRISVPYGYKNLRGEVLASYDFNIVTLEGGFRTDVMDRTFRETEQTTENILHIAADVRPTGWLVWRNSFEFGSRDYDEYDQTRGESASFEEDEQVNIPGLKRFDQAKRDTDRIISSIIATPFGGPVSLSAAYTRYFDDYTEDAEFGLQTWRNQTFTLEADYTPGDRWSVFGFYTREDWTSFQRGRQSGSTFSTNPADNWTARNSDLGDTVGLGANFTIIPDKATFNVSGRLNRVNGNGDFDSPPGGTPDVAVDIPNIDDTRFGQISGELLYKVAQAWDVGLGAWYENYEIDDALNAGTQQYLPASFFLAPNDLGYRGGAVYVRTTYRW